jgi:RimJ/RimL family protein N-acetyltransferase
LWSNADMPSLTAPVVPAGALSQVAQPILRAGDLVLRPWAEGDAAALVAAFADPEIQRWHARTVESLAEASDMIARYQRAWRNETGAHWAVTGPEVIGRVALRTVDLEEGCAEIAYWVTPAARGRGAAPGSAIALSGWALGELGLHRLDLEHSVANAASCRVAQKAGFAYEGTRRSAVLHGDGWHDMHLHARIRGTPDGPR